MKKQATIDRMVTPKHICPWGIKAYDLLKRNGYEVTDNHIGTQEANKAYKEKNDVDETPQIFIDGERIGGYDQLRDHPHFQPDPGVPQNPSSVEVNKGLHFYPSICSI